MKIKTIICFLIGPISTTLTTAICFCMACCVARIVQHGFNKEILTKICKRILSYFIFLLVANRMDAMGLNLLFGWQGNTQLLVAVWIAVTEVKYIFILVKQFLEVETPAIITERLDQMQSGQINPGIGYVNSQCLDEQIMNLKLNMDKLKELAQLQAQNNAANMAANQVYVAPENTNLTKAAPSSTGTNTPIKS